MSAPAMLCVTIFYLVAVLSVSVKEPQKLIWLSAYPIIASELSGMGFEKVFVRSLMILPFVGLIGILNPLYDRTEAFEIGDLTITGGWISFLSIILRGLLSFQGIILLAETTGFLEVFRAFRHMGMPRLICSQMMLTYRYLSVLIEEAIIMRRSRKARGFGKDSYPLNMWGQFIGQLLIRSTHRASNIHRAMTARGFDGTLPTGNKMAWTKRDIAGLLISCGTIAALRVIDFSRIISQYLDI